MLEQISSMEMFYINYQGAKKEQAMSGSIPWKWTDNHLSKELPTYCNSAKVKTEVDLFGNRVTLRCGLIDGAKTNTLSQDASTHKCPKNKHIQQTIQFLIPKTFLKTVNIPDRPSKTMTAFQMKGIVDHTP